jgi:hypothetical protein
MNRTVAELKTFIENIPDTEEISFWGEGITFYHESDGEFGNEVGSCIVTAQFQHEKYEDENY